MLFYTIHADDFVKQGKWFCENKNTPFDELRNSDDQSCI